MSQWTFITNHGAVLALMAQHGQITARDIASLLGITERSVHRIIFELETEGYIEKAREGRLNQYGVNHERPLRRPERRDVPIGELLRILEPQPKLEEKPKALPLPGTQPLS